MNFNVFSLLSLIAGLLCVMLSFLVAIIKQKSYSALAFAKVCLFIGIWTLFPFSTNLAKTNEEALAFARLVYIAAIFVPYLFFKFMFIIMEVDKDENIKRFTTLSLVCTVLFLLFCHGPLFIKDVIRNKPYFTVIPGTLYFIFIIYFNISYCYVTPKLLNVYSMSKGYRKNQLKYITLAFFLAFVAGSIHFLSAYGIPEVFPHDILVILFSLIFTYAIVRHRLMDITIVITKVSLFIVVYTLVLGVPFTVAILFRPILSAILGINWWIVPLSLMVIFATSGPFIYIYLNKRAEERLLKEQKRYQDTLKMASIGMTRIRELEKLLKLIVYIVAKAVRLNFASIYILDKENTLYRLGAAKKKNNAFVSEINVASSLVNWLIKNKDVLVFEEIKRQMQDDATGELEGLKSQLLAIDAAVIIPSFIGDRLLAFMVLGDKRSGEIYSKDDLQVFTVLANQAALAIENAHFFEEAKEMQEQIAQAEKMATIGTMADGLSHQINNRFHALSMITGDTLDTIKLVDTIQYTLEQKELLSEIQHSLERIQANVAQGGDVVKGMLKYTRKGDAGFSAVTLDKILDAALEMVQYKIKLSQIDIVRDYPKDIPAILGNLTQLQEVFFNLIDNAYDAMMERKDTLKEEGYWGKIRIYTEFRGNGFLKINVEDNGIGARPEDFKKMFTPFFTTKVSSHKGTGLGLYVIKKIVASNHRGRINVESTYKQGTRFTLEIPLAKN